MFVSSNLYDCAAGIDVGRNIKVFRSWALANTASGIVVRAMARAEPPTILANIAGLSKTDRDTTQVRAVCFHNQILGLTGLFIGLHGALIVRLRILQLCAVVFFYLARFPQRYGDARIAAYHAT